jgi:hypothetical protein
MSNATQQQQNASKRLQQTQAQVLNTILNAISIYVWFN